MQESGGISNEGPTCANLALQKTAEDNRDQFDGDVAGTIKSNFYVDDCLKSVITEKQKKNGIVTVEPSCIHS